MLRSIKSYQKDLDFKRELIEEDYFLEYIDTQEYNNLIELVEYYEDLLNKLKQDKKSLSFFERRKLFRIIKDIVK